MKKTLLLALFTLIALNGKAQFDKVDLSFWNASGSSFMETPSPDLAFSLGNIWGDFDTRFIEADVQKSIMKLFAVNLHLRTGFIQPNSMYLYNENSYLTIGGAIFGGNLNLLFCPFNSKDLRLAAYAGFSYTRTNKQFNDYQLLGVIINSGNFGYYKSSMFGPEIGIIAGKSFLMDLIDVELTLFTDPLYENEVLVAGWSADPEDDYAKGYRFGGSLFAGVQLSKYYAGLGYRYEKSYFKYSINDQYDLDLHFSGLQLRAGVKF